MKQSKRYLALLLSLALLHALFPFSALAAEKPICGFSDVDKSDWFAPAVQYAFNNGLMKGTSTTTFPPESPTTRAMFVRLFPESRSGKEPHDLFGQQHVDEEDI